MTFVSLEKGAGVPASWSFVYEDTGSAGQVDIVLTDATAAAATLAGPTADVEVVKLTFERVGVDCDSPSFDFNGAAPVSSAQIAAFPENHYIIVINGATSAVEIQATSTVATAGPLVDDHGFIRGNINNRAMHVLDLGDVIDELAFLFGSPSLTFDCDAAFDADNDGVTNILDVIVLVQGVFGIGGVQLAPPNGTNPGVGIPGVVTVDGGSIPSILGCNEGETCP